jgi:uncharacterized protein YqfA (UPF0365 family)
LTTEEALKHKVADFRADTIEQLLKQLALKGAEVRARVVEAEAEVPRAMAEAFRQGNLGIMDYYRQSFAVFERNNLLRAKTGRCESGDRRRAIPT